MTNIEIRDAYNYPSESEMVVSLAGKVYSGINKKGNRYIIDQNNKIYKTIRSLQDIFPKVVNEENLANYAKLANFIKKGHQYEYIENVKSYKEETSQTVNFMMNSFDHPCHPGNFATMYDVSKMETPKIEGSIFTCYFLERNTQRPHKFVCGKSLEKVKYQPLPFIAQY